ncbi:MAG: secretin N-terminal domain-containing protein, partial [Candidatus Omnitrophota bacterium]|nr:secretin N-terminal domain-containing protein [Candidatus Omnitrophota bacterium]
VKTHVVNVRELGLWAFVILVGAAPLWAADEGATPDEAMSQASVEAPEEIAAGASEETAAPPETASPAGTVSVDFKDADIRQVLRIISLKSGVDIVAGPDVEGLVTIKLTDVPWEQALGIILRTYGFTYEREGNIARVMTLEGLEQEALSTKVFPLNYAKAKEVPDVIKEMLSDRGKVKYDDRTNTVIVTDIPTTLFQIAEVIERLDQRTQQVLIETKIIETKLEKNENLGIDWSDSVVLSQTATAFPSSFPFTKTGTLGRFGDAFISTPSGIVGGPSALLATVAAGNIGIGTLTGPAFAWTMNAIASRTDTRIISNPSLAVLNNQEAKIHIGEEYPVPSYSLDQTTGRISVSGYTPKTTGTVLTVTPHVNASNEIVIDLKPELITVGTPVTFAVGSGSVDFPRFTTQTAKTQVRVQNTETIAIGGLIKESKAKIESKVPFLGDIPLVGLLFKNTRWYSGGSDPVQQDVLIFLTVKLLDEPEGDTQAVALAPAEPPAPY